MKLNDIQRILENSVSKLDFEVTETNKAENNIPIVNLLGLNQYRAALNEIEKTSLIANEIERLRQTPIYTSFRDTIILRRTEADKIIEIKEQIRIIANGILESLRSIAVPHLENSIVIKLPNDISDFDNLSKVSSELQTILSQSIINKHINGEIKIQSVENGSIWIEVYVGTAAALTLVASLTWSAMVIYKKLQEGKIFHQYAEGLKIKNENLKEMQIAQKTQLDLLIEAEATNLMNEHFENVEPEQLERLKYSVRMLSELIDKGAEVHAALNTPETVANLFPDKNNLATIESKIKQIEK